MALKLILTASEAGAFRKGILYVGKSPEIPGAMERSPEGHCS